MSRLMRPDDLDIFAGQMQRRVTLQRLTETADAYGQRVKSWTDAGTLWAAIQPLAAKGVGLVNADQVKSVQRLAVIIRYQPSLSFDPTFRVVYGTRIFNLESVVNVAERGKKTVLICTEQVAPRTN